MKLIDKDTVVAEIEKRLHKYEQEYEELARYEIWGTAIKIKPKIEELKNLRSFIDTIETKEGVSSDAFIEKAVEWLEVHKGAIETEDSNIMGWIPDYFIENFKNHMKGE